MEVKEMEWWGIWKEKQLIKRQEERKMVSRRKNERVTKKDEEGKNKRRKR